MYIVITEKDVHIARTLNQINKKLDAAINKDDFCRIGKHYVVVFGRGKVYEEGKSIVSDLEFVQDLKELQRVSLGKLFRPKPLDLSTILIIIILFIQLILLVRG